MLHGNTLDIDIYSLVLDGTETDEEIREAALHLQATQRRVDDAERRDYRLYLRRQCA